MAQALRQQAGARAARPAARIWLALGTVYVLWGSTYLGIKYAIETIPPLMMGSLRFIAAGGVLYLLAIRSGDRRRDPIGGRQWMAALLIGGALLVGGNGGVILAEQYAPTGSVPCRWPRRRCGLRSSAAVASVRAFRRPSLS